MTESACTILRDLRAHYQGTPILTLAQTALWDDPLKALVKALLDAEAPGTRLVLGIMDTDYFSRLPKPPPGFKPFDVLPHNEGSTRDLWAAVGEMHSLLGAETPLPVHTLAEEGVRFCRVIQAANAGYDPGDCTRFIDDLTQAWGWRGLAQTKGRRLLAGDVPLRDAGDALIRQVDWALAETSRVAERPLGPFATRLRARVVEFVGANPDASLTDLYLDLLPGIYQTLLGYEPAGLEYARSSELLQFNRWTANRARFRPLDLFLDPRTAPIAKRHYNGAVRGGGIATLDRFGPDALPFDIAIPGHGRGTLHLSADLLHVDTDEPIDISLARPITSRRQLAIVLEDSLGPGVALLGKAVVLITMLAGEYIFLFNETGSPYVTRSCRWNALLHAEGLGLRLYPILRLGVKPWDNVSKAGGHLALPPHMARIFGEDRISATEFERRFRGAVRNAEASLKAIRRFEKPVDWMDHLAGAADGVWTDRATEYRELRAQRAQHGILIQRVNAEGARVLDDLRRVRADVSAMEQEKGQHWRACVMPLRDASPRDEDEFAAAMGRRAEYEARINDTRRKIADAETLRSEIAVRRRELQDDPGVGERAARIRVLEGEAELEKARQVHDAWMTYQALEHSQPRPSAWWFPAVDPSGAWFRAVAESAEFRWQPLTGEACADPSALSLPDVVTI
ncbi:MAG TPA: hypothetical protein VGM51_17245 [Armatimonadota bacterium]|jgi:hypothetical protein